MMASMLSEWHLLLRALGSRQKGVERQRDHAGHQDSVNLPRQGNGLGGHVDNRLCSEAQDRGLGEEKVMTVFVYDVAQ